MPNSTKEGTIEQYNKTNENNRNGDRNPTNDDIKYKWVNTSIKGRDFRLD